MSVSIAALGEHALIARLRQRVGPTPSHVQIGIGDDAAVMAPERGAVDVLTTDCLVEGVHFRRDWTALSAVGHKALAVSLSDLAAMGATPRASLLSLVLPDSLPVDDFDALVDGYVALATASGAALIGGNMTRSPGPVVVDVTAVGSVRRRRVMRRDTALAGDELYVTGQVGAAAAGLAMLTAAVPRHAMNHAALACVARYERPDARVRCGTSVGRTGAASAAMDLSDGLAAAARGIAEASGLGVTIDAAAVPLHEGARSWAEQAGIDPVTFALAGGEDYEIAFAVRPRQRRKFLAACRRSAGLAVTRIGRFTAEPGAWLDRSGRTEPVPTGFNHF